MRHGTEIERDGGLAAYKSLKIKIVDRIIYHTDSCLRQGLIVFSEDSTIVKQELFQECWRQFKKDIKSKQIEQKASHFSIAEQ